MKIKRLLPILTLTNVVGMSSCLVACKPDFGPVEPIPVPDPESVALTEVVDWPWQGDEPLPAIKTSQKYDMLSNKTFNITINMAALMASGKVGEDNHFTLMITNRDDWDFGTVDIKSWQFKIGDEEIISTIADSKNINFEDEGVVQQMKGADEITGSVTIENYGKSTPPTDCAFVLYWSNLG